MDNHCRMYATIFIILVSIVSYSWAESIRIDQQFNLIDVYVGDDVDLHCDSHLSVDRQWKRGEEILTKANTVRNSNPRIESLNSSTILRIKNVSVDDQGEYECAINTKHIQSISFDLRVIVVLCAPPEKPLNGYFKGDSNSSDIDSYPVNARIEYFCNRGFEIVGSAIRTCSRHPQVWTPDEPSCEPEFIVRLQKSVAVIGNKVAALESKITTLENKVATLENRTTTCDNECRDRCRNGFIKLGNQCYFFGTDLRSWSDSLTACKKLGTTLAYPKNAEENSLLKDHVRKNYKTLDWWIGGTDEAKEGRWVWTHDQSPIVYTDWLKGEPNNGGRPGAPENCLFIGGQWTTTFQWLDAPCGWKEAFICQEKI